MNNIGKWSSFVLWGLSIITIVVLALFFLGGDGVGSSAEMWEPKNVDVLLYWSYIVLLIGVCSTICFSIYKFLKRLTENPKEALMSLLGGVAVILLFVVCWFLGDGTPLNIIGYEGNENTYFWLKWTDMLIYASYFLVSIAVLAIVSFGAIKVLKK